MRYLNLGCGSHYHLDWININFTSSSSAVVAYDLTKGIPFPDYAVDVIYHSHLLEHFPQYKADFFIKECHRVLKKRGIIRVVVPDLEKIIVNYFNYLQECLDGRTSNVSRYCWTLMELFDQMVREKPGGEMKNFLEKATTAERQFIGARIGKEAEDFWQVTAPKFQQGLFRRLWRKSPREIGQHIRRQASRIVVRLIAGKEAVKAYDIGLFRCSGEVHHWMYDRYSLGELLRQAGFQEIKVCNPFESLIPNFEKYELDVVNGTIRKPDSLFLEAVKP